MGMQIPNSRWQRFTGRFPAHPTEPGMGELIPGGAALPFPGMIWDLVPPAPGAAPGWSWIPPRAHPAPSMDPQECGWSLRAASSEGPLEREHLELFRAAPAPLCLQMVPKSDVGLCGEATNPEPAPPPPLPRAPHDFLKNPQRFSRRDSVPAALPRQEQTKPLPRDRDPPRKTPPERPEETAGEGDGPEDAAGRSRGTWEFRAGVPSVQTTCSAGKGCTVVCTLVTPARAAPRPDPQVSGSRPSPG